MSSAFSTFLRLKLRAIEDYKKKPPTKNSFIEFHLKVVQEIVDRDPKGLLSQVLKEVKVGLQQHILKYEQDLSRKVKKQEENFKAEVTKLLSQLQKAQEQTKIFKEKCEDSEREVLKQKSTADNFEDELTRLGLKFQEYQGEFSAKAKKVNDLEAKNIQLSKAVMYHTKETDLFKCRENNYMYRLHLLHFKGYPVSDLYENEIKNIPTERFRPFKFDDSQSKSESKIEPSSEMRSISIINHSSEFFKNQFDNSNVSFDPIVMASHPQNERPNFIPELKLEDMLFMDDSQDMIKITRYPEQANWARDILNQYNPTQDNTNQEYTNQDSLGKILQLQSIDAEKLNSELTYENSYIPEIDIRNNDVSESDNYLHYPSKPMGDKATFCDPSSIKREDISESSMGLLTYDVPYNFNLHGVDM